MADRQQLNDIIIADYPRAVTARFFSCSDPTAYTTNQNYIANDNDGFWDELEKIGIAVTDPSLIPEQLVSITSMSDLLGQKASGGIVLKNINFTVYDVKRTSAVLSSGIQNADVNNALTASIATQNNIYVQTPGLNAVPVSWQPNWFNPRVKVNGKQVFGTITNNYYNTAHAGLASVGTDVNIDRDYAIYFPSIDSVEVYARCCQRIRTAAGNVFYMPYAVSCEVEFRMHS